MTSLRVAAHCEAHLPAIVVIISDCCIFGIIGLGMGVRIWTFPFLTSSPRNGHRFCSTVCHKIFHGSGENIITPFPEIIISLVRIGLCINYMWHIICLISQSLHWIQFTSQGMLFVFAVFTWKIGPAFQVANSSANVWVRTSRRPTSSICRASTLGPFRPVMINWKLATTIFVETFVTITTEMLYKQRLSLSHTHLIHSRNRCFIPISVHILE